MNVTVARVRLLKRLLATQRRMAEAVKAERRKRGLTQGQVAEAIGVKQPFFAQLESGRSPMTIARFLGIAEVVGFNPCKLMKDCMHSARILSSSGRRKGDDRARAAS